MSFFWPEMVYGDARVDLRDETVLDSEGADEITEVVTGLKLATVHYTIINKLAQKQV